ncbi:hypothetical protein SteCoe_5883 [Stentor coeruleus]|uniref:Uncharacterized protein n=1 Tax=Stentor coeruleus TaxID=5963 RepID=A0A1R2CRA0_9CILI|nr:hypothetical protein SteCoe_5883 [Stentor coeruleus]
MSQKRQSRSKPKIILSTPNKNFHTSPRIAKIKAAAKSEKSHDEIACKLTMVSSPKLPKRIINRSPFIACHQIISFSKLIPLRKTSTHRISSRSTNQTKNMTTTEATPTNISCTALPPPQDFRFLLLQLLDYFPSPETLTDYFFLNRKNLLDYFDFYESCLALGITVFFSDLSKIFDEACKEKVLSRKRFLTRAIEVQNAECWPEKKERKNTESLTLSRIMKKILRNSSDTLHNRMKKFLMLIRHAKNPTDLSAKIQNEHPAIRLSDQELSVLMEYTKVQKCKKKKPDLNMTFKLTRSPYTLIPCSVAYRKNMLSLSKTPPRRGKS